MEPSKHVWLDIGVNGTYDYACRTAFKGNPSTTISWFLTSSFCYYVHDESLLSDDVFDRMCKYMLENWDKLEHQHKYLITEDDLRAASGFAIHPSKYPTIVQSSSHRFMEELEKWRNKSA